MASGFSVFFLHGKIPKLPLKLSFRKDMVKCLMFSSFLVNISGACKLTREYLNFLIKI